MQFQEENLISLLENNSVIDYFEILSINTRKRIWCTSHYAQPRGDVNHSNPDSDSQIM